MTDRVCSECRFFCPAQTCIVKPTWGHCTKLLGCSGRDKLRKVEPLFTWANDTCEVFQPRASAAPRR
jgi:hypothetical protein